MRVCVCALRVHVCGIWGFPHLTSCDGRCEGAYAWGMYPWQQSICFLSLEVSEIERLRINSNTNSYVT